jgi:N-acetylmuramoyl-L-alanine amidase CwlA
MTSTGFARNSFRMQFDFVAYAKILSNPGNPNDLIDDALKYLYRLNLSPQVKQQLKSQMLLTGQQYDYYWTNAWSAYIASPTAANLAIVNTRLKTLFQYLMNLSEYQLC